MEGVAAVNEPTRCYHGLKAALVLVGLVKAQATGGRLQLADISLELEDGTAHSFTQAQYIEMAEEALHLAINRHLTQDLLAGVALSE